MIRVARNWNPLRDLSRMQQDMSDLFGRSPWVAFGDVSLAPAIDVYQGKNDVIVKAILPGLKIDELDITLTAETLTLKGSFENEMKGEDANWQRRERHLQPFERTLPLPFEVDPESAEAVYENGILSVKAKRPVHQQPRKIQLKTT
ncbi:MAG: Hsp20/alpha crystallin family protein [Planctomycetaceae bacterium]